jgi:hypothetical protein
MDDFLAKPSQPADLWAAMDRVVGSRPPAEPPGPDLLAPQVLLAACGGDAAALEEICETFRVRLPEHLRPFGTPCATGTRPGCARRPISLPGWWRRFPRRPAAGRRTWRTARPGVVSTRKFPRDKWEYPSFTCACGYERQVRRNAVSRIAISARGDQP